MDYEMLKQEIDEKIKQYNETGNIYLFEEIMKQLKQLYILEQGNYGEADKAK